MIHSKAWANALVSATRGVCPECKGQLAEDYTSSDDVCLACGLVIDRANQVMYGEEQKLRKKRLQVVARLSRFSSDLRLPVTTIVSRGEGLYRKIEDKKLSCSRKYDTLAAAIVYCCCREDGIPRTLKEIAASCGVPKRDLGP